MTVSDGSIARLVASAPDWHVWVLHYGITHQLIVLGLHHGNVQDSVRVYLEGVVSLHGLLKGGPYRLSLSTRDGLHVLAADDGSFVVEAQEIEMAKE